VFEREEAREKCIRAEKEREAMLERFNEYGQEMQRRQDEIIERVKREMGKKVKEIVERAEVAEEREQVARAECEEERGRVEGIRQEYE